MALKWRLRNRLDGDHVGYEKHPLDAQIVQAAPKWKRTALKQFGMRLGERRCTDMRAVRKGYFLDHAHSVHFGATS